MDLSIFSNIISEVRSLSLFPFLLNYSIFAPLFLRLALGLHSLSLAKDKWKGGKLFGKTVYRKALSIILAVVGLALLLGTLTQAAALITSVFALVMVIRKEKRRDSLITLGASLALLVLGAGPFAFDLPL